MPKKFNHHYLFGVQLEAAASIMWHCLVAVAVLGFASCGRLDSQYLPPNQQSYSSGVKSGAYADQNSGPINKAANDVPILRLDNNNDGETYNYALETGDGVSAHEEGDAKGDGTRAQGGFSYVAPDGQQIQIQYSADENGFQPQGSHIPVAPPVPEEILKALEQNSAEEAKGIFDDGQYREEGSSSTKYNGNINNQYVPPGAPTRSQNGYKY